jgi:hypothetical protein
MDWGGLVNFHLSLRGSFIAEAISLTARETATPSKSIDSSQ